MQNRINFINGGSDKRKIHFCRFKQNCFKLDYNSFFLANSIKANSRKFQSEWKIYKEKVSSSFVSVGKVGNDLLLFDVTDV